MSEVSWRNVVIAMVPSSAVGFDVRKGGYDSGGNLGGGKQHGFATDPALLF